MKPETFTAGEQPSTSYETLLKPYGTPAEVLALVRMGGMLSFNGDRLTNFAWSIAELAELGGAFNDAMQSADCPAHINSGTLGALLVSIQASSHAIQRILDEALEIGDLAGIRRGKAMRARPKEGAVPAAPAADLASRLASAAAQAVRKTNVQTGTIPGRTRSGEFRVRFDDGRAAVYRIHLELVREVR